MPASEARNSGEIAFFTAEARRVFGVSPFLPDINTAFAKIWFGCVAFQEPKELPHIPYWDCNFVANAFPRLEILP